MTRKRGNKMRVLKRTGELEPVSFDKVLARIQHFCDDLPAIDPCEIGQQVCLRIYDGVKTSELDELTAQLCASRVTEHPDYGTLAARITISNHHKNTSPSFSETISILYGAKDARGKPMPLISDELMEIVQANREKLNSIINYDRDYTFDYFGFKTLERSYLLKLGLRTIERPQHMWMRVALGIHSTDLKDAIQTYELMSTKAFTHATPTLFNAGTRSQQLASCFVAGTMVYTQNRGCQPINRIRVGDLVVTHLGNVKPVVQLHANPIAGRRLFDVTAFNTPMLTVTDNHEFMSMTSEQAAPQWNRVDHLRVGDWIQIPNYAAPQEIDVVVNEFPIDLDVARRLGFWYASGTPNYTFQELFGDATSLSPVIHTWPNEFVHTFLVGFMSADRKTDVGLARDVFALGRSRGLAVAIHFEAGDRAWLRMTESNRVRVVAGKTLVRIDAKCPSTRQDQTVYTLGVADDHSYMVEGLCAKNCYLIAMQEDSIAGIYDTLKQAALISKFSGGIGLHIHDIRATNSLIRGTNGKSTGIIPMLKVFNDTARYVNQSGKRNGSMAIYMEPWHADVEQFLDLRKNNGAEEQRCRDLFTAMWVPDLFMERVAAGGQWSLMCPDECPGLSDVYGADFVRLYERYESEGSVRKTLPAKDLFLAILTSQIETGTPYMLFKDACNQKSNQKNLGTIKSSNLCSEVVQFSSKDETATCNLASLCLPTYVNTGDASFDFERLHRTVGVVVKNLNKVIDRNMYPVPETARSNLLHRPIGIGVQGLSDVFTMLRKPFDSPEAASLNREIFECIYHGAVTASMELARKRELIVRDGDADQLKLTPEEAKLTAWPGAYATFAGSPASQGLLQFDLWPSHEPRGRWEWDQLKADVVRWGLRNSLLVAPMPTASTSQIMGFTEAFEPPTSNIFQRRVLAGDFVVVNKYLIADLLALGLWNAAMKNQILIGEGSIQHIPEIPADIKALYKTVWEIKQRVLIDQSADRGRYVCQSQSLNLYVESPDFAKLTNMHFHSWRSGLKTGMYYLRSRPRSRTAAYTIDPTEIAKVKKEKDDGPVCRRDDPACLWCSA